MPRRAGGGRRKRRTHRRDEEGEEYRSIPKSFVLKRGDVNNSVKALLSDWKKVMSPYCALKLRDSKRNSLKDYISASAALKVSHLVLFTQRQKTNCPTLRLIKLPAGPTLSFHVKEYTLSSDLKSDAASAFSLKVSPFIVLSGFRELATQKDANKKSSSFPTQLVATFLGHMFPPLDIETTTAKDCRRVLLFDHDKETHLISVRQYVVKKRPSGVSKGIKKLIKAKTSAKKLFSIAPKKDVSDLLLDTEDGGGSESEYEETTEIPITTNDEEQIPLKLLVSLTEIGPRLTLDLFKVEESSISTGKVLYNKYTTKTPEEIAALDEFGKKMKEKRKRELDELLGNEEEPLKKIKS